MKELIFDHILGEYRVALIEDNKVQDFIFEREDHRGSQKNSPLLNNIYKGKIKKIIPGIQAAFIDIGWTRTAFLHVKDAQTFTSIDEEESQQKIVPIQELITEGQEILVQISKEPISSKGPRVTCHITLAGRYVVFMPLHHHIGISKKIEGKEERVRLLEILTSICDSTQGLIARTMAADRSSRIIKNDQKKLVQIWKHIEQKRQKLKAPTICYRETSFLDRLFRDVIDEDIDKIIVDTQEHYDEIKTLSAHCLRSLKGKIELHTGSIPLFEKYGIDREIEKGIVNVIDLPSGGSLNIEQTEALLAIDVNTGKFIGKQKAEDTILTTNLEAVEEISYQLKLRNSGGIIIIDCIDMKSQEHKDLVSETLVKFLEKDKAKTYVLPISSLGIIEMTRKRTRDTLSRILCDPCPHCKGIGRIKSVLTICYELIRALYKILPTLGAPIVYIHAHPEVLSKMRTDDLLKTLEEHFNKSLRVKSDKNYSLEKYKIFTQ